MSRNIVRDFLFGRKAGAETVLNVTPVSGETLIRAMRARKDMARCGSRQIGYCRSDHSHPIGYTRKSEKNDNMKASMKTPLCALRTRKGMTLMEVLIAMAIISIVSMMVITAFGATLKSEMLSTQSKNNSSAVEKQIASGAAGKKTNLSFNVGGFGISADANKYTEGNRSYSLIGGSDTIAKFGLVFGDLTNANMSALKNIYGNDYIIDCGKQGGVLEYAVPYTGRYYLEAWGAKGGDAGYPESAVSYDYSHGANGGYACGEIFLNEGTILNFYAGGAGLDDLRTSTIDMGTGANLQGGFNGGGQGKTGGYGHASGGGGSDIRITGDSIYDRVIVAGGGGGGGSWAMPTSYFGVPGAGGGVNGIDVARALPPVTVPGGTQSSGGGDGGAFGGNNAVPAGSVSFASGGGGGWYGGGSGTTYNHPGTGGSGWVFTGSAFAAWNPVNSSFSQTTDKSNYNVDNYTMDAATSLDGSGYGYSMINASLIAGNAPMPNPADTSFDMSNPASAAKTITGNAGGGVIRIVYLGKQ